MAIILKSAKKETSNRNLVKAVAVQNKFPKYHVSSKLLLFNALLRQYFMVQLGIFSLYS